MRKEDRMLSFCIRNLKDSFIEEMCSPLYIIQLLQKLVRYEKYIYHYITNNRPSQSGFERNGTDLRDQP